MFNLSLASVRADLTCNIFPLNKEYKLDLNMEERIRTRKIPTSYIRFFPDKVDRFFPHFLQFHLYC